MLLLSSREDWPNHCAWCTHGLRLSLPPGGGGMQNCERGRNTHGCCLNLKGLTFSWGRRRKAFGGSFNFKSKLGKYLEQGTLVMGQSLPRPLLASGPCRQTRQPTKAKSTCLLILEHASQCIGYQKFGKHDEETAGPLERPGAM